MPLRDLFDRLFQPEPIEKDKVEPLSLQHARYQNRPVYTADLTVSGAEAQAATLEPVPVQHADSPWGGLFFDTEDQDEDSWGRGDLVGSLVRQHNGTKWHRPVIDVDFPVRVIPSTTPGHCHLYIEREVEQGLYWRLLDALADCGIVERGFAEASKAKGQSTVRPPWRPKEESERRAEYELGFDPDTPHSW